VQVNIIGAKLGVHEVKPEDFPEDLTSSAGLFSALNLPAVGAGHDSDGAGVNRQEATPGTYFGQMIRHYRRASGLSQEELGDRAGVTPRTICDLERGRTTRPYRQTVGSLAEALRLQGPELEEFVRLSRLGRHPAPADGAAEPGEVRGRTGPATTAGHPHPGIPRQLPAAVSHFTGRAAEFDALTSMLSEATGTRTAVISAIAGTAGVGKTALALQWAHQVGERFPDGQLYVNLRGYDPALPPLPATEAIRQFLDAFEIPAGRIPASPEAQAGLYRSVLAGKKVVIVADNAADAARSARCCLAVPAAWSS